MLWLNARSLAALGRITATRNGLASAVGTAVGDTMVGSGEAGELQAVRARIITIAHESNFHTFIFRNPSGEFFWLNIVTPLWFILG
jgi:hypothetical protein